MNDKLIKWLRGELPMGDDCIAPDRVCVAGDCPCDSANVSAAADRIEYLERELSEERHSREVAAQKAWEFSDRIKKLEKALTKISTAKLEPCDKFCGHYLDLQLLAKEALDS